MLLRCSLTRTILNFVKNQPPTHRPFFDSTLPVISSHQYSTDISKSGDVHKPFQEVIEDNIEEERIKSTEIIKKVNNHIADGSYGRLFAVIYILGKQYKVTAEDVLVIERYWAPKMKDKIRFEKVLLVGGANFTLIGKPILPTNIVNVSATILNKDLTYTKFRFFKIAKERVHNLNFVRESQTFLRINKIEVYPQLNELSYSEYARTL